MITLLDLLSALIPRHQSNRSLLLRQLALQRQWLRLLTSASQMIVGIAKALSVPSSQRTDFLDRRPTLCPKAFIPVHPHTMSRHGANVFPTGREGSLLLTPEDSQTAQQQMPHASTTSSKVRSSSARRQPRPSLPSHWKSSGDINKDAPPMPPRQSSVDAASSAFPVQANQQDHSIESSPESRGLSWQSTPFSSDYSLRCSHRPKLLSGPTRVCPVAAPALCAPHSVPPRMRWARCGQRCDGSRENTEELDENSVGLGITSDLGMDASSRRSSAVPVMPSPMLPGSAKALQGPFSHHRAPSWTRRMDSAPFAGLSSLHQSGEMGDTFGASAQAGLRSLD